MPVSIYRKPAEVESQLPFDEDDAHRSYDAEYATRCWRVVRSSANVFDRFRSRYYGKASPVHFFWGSFDLAVTRFSGRRAPPHPGGVPNLPDRVTRDAYSHEVSSAGFWPGGVLAPYPLFYSYAYPEPRGFADAKVQPLSARYEPALREFILPYDDVRQASDPDRDAARVLPVDLRGGGRARGLGSRLTRSAAGQITCRRYGVIGFGEAAAREALAAAHSPTIRQLALTNRDFCSPAINVAWRMCGSAGDQWATPVTEPTWAPGVSNRSQNPPGPTLCT